MRTCLGVLMSLLFIPILTLSLIGLGLKQVFFSAQTYQNYLNQDQHYQKIVNLVADEIPQMIGEQDNQMISAQDLKQIAVDSIQVDWLKVQTEKTLSAFFGWINGNNQQFNAVIDLRPLKTALSQSIEHYQPGSFQKLPLCTPKQITEIEKNKNLALTCRPPGVSEQQLSASQTQLNKNFIAEINNKIPDNYDLGQQFTQNNNKTIQSLNQLRTWLRTANLILWGLIILVITVILIFLILNRTALRNFFQDIGYPLLITGLILLVIILMVKTVPSMLEKQLTPELQKLTLDQKELVLSFINYLTGQIKSWITVLTFCFVGGGVIMIITAYFFPGAKKVVPKQQ